jgi:hypothetical protein
MSADNGIYILGPCVDGSFRVAYSACIDNISYPSMGDPEAIESAKDIFERHPQPANNITSAYRSVKCDSQEAAFAAAQRLKELFLGDDDDFAILEYGIVSLGPYPYNLD